MQVSSHLTFGGTCEAAFQFYERTLVGKIVTMLTYGNSPMADQVPSGWRGKIIHASLTVGDTVLAGADALPEQYVQPQGFYVLLSVDDPVDAERIFHALAESGEVRMAIQKTFWSPRFGVLVDQFGIPWEISCEQATSAGVKTKDSEEDMTLPDCVIQRVSVLQADDVFSLVEEYYEAVEVVARDTRATMRRYLANAATGVWVAYCGTSPVGCILFHPLPEIPDAGEVKRLYVRPVFRHRGVAQQLLANLEQFALVAGVQWLYLDTKDDMPGAIAFYERNGFARCPRYNNNPQATIFMRKRLGSSQASGAGP